MLLQDVVKQFDDKQAKTPRDVSGINHPDEQSVNETQNTWRILVEDHHFFQWKIQDKVQHVDILLNLHLGILASSHRSGVACCRTQAGQMIKSIAVTSKNPNDCLENRKLDDPED